MGERWAQADIPEEVLLEVLYHLRLQVFQVVRETCANSKQKEDVPARVHELLNLRYHHTMRGYLTYKDQQISHLHQQKIGIIGQMAAGMAHEIRNPLTAIGGFLRLMQTSLDRQEAALDAEQFSQYIRICQHEVQTLEQLVTSFLILARKNESVKLQNQHAVDSNGEVHVKLQGDLERAHVVVTVEDNGCGIPERRLKHLFEPFYTTKEKGTGMGLSVCKQLVEEMGGQIFVQSAVGIGTRIDIHFQKTL